MKESYLLTGGAGFIGCNTADHYLTQGRRVTILDDFSRPGTEKNLRWLRSRHGDGFSVLRADVCTDRDVIERAVEEADVVIHLAAQVAVTTSVQEPRRDFEINALGTLNVLEAVRASRSRPIVLYSSTNKVYGKMADVDVEERNGRYAYCNLPAGVSESRPLDFYSPYGCSKGCGDQYMVDYARIYGLRTVTLRQSCIYGPHQFGMEDQGWVAWFSIRAMLEQPVSVYGDGKQVRDVLFVDDLVAAYDAAVERIDVAGGQAYNVGGGPANTLSLLELIEMLDKRFERPLEHRFADWRPGDQLVFVSDISKAKRDLGWQPRMDVEAGVDRLLGWLSDHKELFL